MAQYDFSTFWGRLRAKWDFWWGDHAFLRLGFSNAHWIGPDMIRANHPWPFQLAWWKKRGLKTVINLRGGPHSAHYQVEEDAVKRLGMDFVVAPLGSREVPSRERILNAKALFETIQYPALMHCKSGADRAGIMAVLYRHFHLGHPIREAVSELGLRTLHVRQGKTGVLDYFFERYLTEIEPQGISFLDWVMSDEFDPDAIKADFQAGWWATLLTDKILRRE